jgi:hypothetical protein
MSNIIKSIKLFENKCVGQRDNEVEPKGFPASLSFTDILKIAIDNKCNVMVRCGQGKWYLKKKNYKETKMKLISNEWYNREYHNTYLIKYKKNNEKI